MRNNTRRRLLLSMPLIAVFMMLVFYFAYQKYLASTKIAFVNYPDYILSDIVSLNKNKFIDIQRINWKANENPELSDYAAVYIFGMGLNPSAEQKAKLKKAVESGTAVYVNASTSTENDLTTLYGKNLEYVSDCLSNGGRENYLKLLNFSRREIDGKKLFSEEISAPLKIPSDCFFHIAENSVFESFDEFLAYYKKQGFHKKDAPSVCFLTTNVGPGNVKRDHINDIIEALEKKNINVFPVYGFRKRIDFIKAAKPDLVILMPHGRFSADGGDEAVNYLKEANIPLLCPVNVFEPHEKWLADQRGMAGGILSQSIVMPELDGGTAPYVLTAQFKNESGIYEFRALPERIEKFSNYVEKLLALRKKENKDKKIAIIYYKGPGANAMNAAGLEVGESLLNFLKHLRQAGYSTGDLPENTDDFLKLIQANASVFAPYAKGAEDKFINEAKPELIPAATYLKWISSAMARETYSEVEKNYGYAPGEYMRQRKDNTDYLLVSRLVFGNVALIPQPLPGQGDDSSKLIHGASAPPPHPYIAAYLWARNGFGADALLHFGTHGSMEFTPSKQVALSGNDWPDILAGGIPHFYLYIINNIGEAVIAKRRSYATIVSHLTPPFMTAGLHNEMKELHEKIDAYSAMQDGPLKKEYLESITALTTALNLQKDLSLENTSEALSPENIQKVHNYIHQIEDAKVGKGLYVTGRHYKDDEINETARLMAVDAIAFGLADMDIQKGIITEKQKDDMHFFERNYRERALAVIEEVFSGSKKISAFNEFDIGEVQNCKSEKVQDINPMAMMMAMAADAKDSRNKDSKSTGKSSVRAQDELLKNNLLKAASSPEKLKFLRDLQDPQKFEKALSLTIPRNLARAKEIAKMVPEMKKSLELAEAEEIMTILKAMREERLKEQVLKLLGNPDFQSEIIAEQKKNQERIAGKCLEKEYTGVLYASLDKAGMQALLETENMDGMEKRKEKLSKLKEFKRILDFYAANISLADVIAGMKNPHAGNVAKILKTSSLSLNNNISELQLKIAFLEGKYSDYLHALKTVNEAICSADSYRDSLKKSTDSELASLLNAFSGGFIAPSPGGDPVINPEAVPTGRNLYAIDAERTPTKEAWATAVKLAESLIKNKLAKENQYPRKVAFTLWGGEFIRGYGTEIAEIFYLLGVEPVWDSRGVVRDVKLIPMEKLKRPRIDVVVQTSGQFRGVATSRIYLIDKAVRLAAAAKDSTDEYPNFVKEGNVMAEKAMVARGFSPAEARSLSAVRVFGGVNGNYGSGIMGLVEAGSKWEKDEEIASRYINNMGAMYTQDNWADFKAGVFEAALQNTDTVVHQRSSNTTGPLSLDHVYEFMGGMSIAVRKVTGKDPNGYFNDLRNPSRAFVQDAKEAAMTEARSTVLNPKYINEMMKEGPSAAESFAEVFRNAYGWEVMKPEMLDDYLWEDLKKTYIDDNMKLGIKEFFESKNPYAMQEITAVMLETIRKGYWKANAETTEQIALAHVKLVNEHKAGCSGFVCGNPKLQNMISGLVRNEAVKEAYNRNIENIRNVAVAKPGEKVKGMRLEKEEPKKKSAKDLIKNNILASSIIAILVFLLIFSVFRGCRKSKNSE